jgi:hypothetical protein
MLRARWPTSWAQRLVLLVLAGNALLILLGALVVPSTLRSMAGVWDLVGAAGLQGVVALAALVGPFAFGRYPRILGISVGCGVLFAVAYLSILAPEFAGIQLSFDAGPGTIYTMFVATALLAGVGANLRTRRFRDGVVASCWALVIGTALWSLGTLLLNYALWGSAHWYQFWLGDGAIDDFRSSGSRDLGAFLLQDLQGALFFHPVLSVVIGGIGGVVASALTLGWAHLWQWLHRPAQTRA